MSWLAGAALLGGCGVGPGQAANPVASQSSGEDLAQAQGDAGVSDAYSCIHGSVDGGDVSICMDGGGQCQADTDVSGLVSAECYANAAADVCVTQNGTSSCVSASHCAIVVGDGFVNRNCDDSTAPATSSDPNATARSCVEQVIDSVPVSVCMSGGTCTVDGNSTSVLLAICRADSSAQPVCATQGTEQSCSTGSACQVSVSPTSQSIHCR